jgi:hypothetical protein
MLVNYTRQARLPLRQPSARRLDSAVRGPLMRKLVVRRAWIERSACLAHTLARSGVVLCRSNHQERRKTPLRSCVLHSD